MSFNPSQLDNTTLQLLRYEALFKLIDDISGLDDIQTIARQVTTRWKYFANVAGWHLVLALGDVFKVIDGFDGVAQVSEVSALSVWDQYHAQLRHPRLLAAADLEERNAMPESLNGKLVSEISVIPFRRGAEVIGWLSTAARHEPLDELDKKFIRLFGRHLADRISDLLLRQLALRALTELATHDALTRLLNRGTVIKELASKLAMSKRTGEPLGLIMIDVDFFKRVNDQYGHQAGDNVLREVSSRLQQRTRDGDNLGRYGGEEFLVVLYPCNEPEIAAAAERLRLAVAERPVSLGGDLSNAIDLTISLGTTWCRGHDTIRMEALLKQADDALYHAKTVGRNCVVQYSAWLDTATR